MIKVSQSLLEQLPEYDNHDSVYLFYDRITGLKGFISIHNVNLGPATGGTRLYSYNNELEGLRDVLNLSKAMTYKCALANVPFGGGKAVIIADDSIKPLEFFKKYGEQVGSLQGKFTTGTDVGVSDEDTKYMALGSEYILGQGNHEDKLSTSKMAALGVFYSIQEIANNFLGKSLSGLKVGIKGVGKLGGELALLLSKEGSQVYISDVDKERIKGLEKKSINIKGVENSEINKFNLDIYSPCALGNEFNVNNIINLKSQAIVGGANNQLQTELVGEILRERGILYAPDYVVNAGGLINIVDELNKDGYNKDRVLTKVKNISNTLSNIIKIAIETNQSTNKVADNLAKEFIYK